MSKEEDKLEDLKEAMDKVCLACLWKIGENCSVCRVRDLKKWIKTNEE